MAERQKRGLHVFEDEYMKIARNQKMSAGAKIASIIAVDRAYMMQKYDLNLDTPITDIVKYWGAHAPTKAEAEAEEELNQLEKNARAERKARSGGDHGRTDSSSK
jgi:hypothetical protein